MVKIHNYKFELLPHPAYSPDLTPSGFHFFSKLKKHFGGMEFSSNEEVQVTVNEYFESLEDSFFKTNIMALKREMHRSSS